VIAACVLTLGTAFGLAGAAMTDLRLTLIGLATLGLVAATRIAPLWLVMLAGMAGLVVL
jgi:hypothetical protein